METSRGTRQVLRTRGFHRPNAQRLPEVPCSPAQPASFRMRSAAQGVRRDGVGAGEEVRGGGGGGEAGEDRQ